MANKVDELNLFLSDNLFDIICISEHWLNKDQLSNIVIRNYDFISSYCRPKNNQHGGVAIFSKSNMFLKSVDVDKFCLSIHAEFCAAEIVNSNTIIIAFYRSSTSGDIVLFKRCLENLIEYLLNKYRYIIMMGDINLDLDANIVHSNDICNILSMFGMTFCIKEPTRVTAGGSSCLDNIMTNFESDRFSTGTCDLHLADHRGTFINVQAGYANTCIGSTTTRIISKTNISLFVSKVGEIKWDDNIVDLNCSDLANIISEILSNIAEMVFPLKSVPNKFNGIRWFNDRLRELRSVLRHSKAVFDKDQTAENWRAYCDIRNTYKKAIKCEKRNAYANEIYNSNNKVKTIWNIVNTERNSKKSVPKSYPISSDDFNLHFSNICNTTLQTIDDTSVHPSDLLVKAPKPPFSFFMPPITAQEVKEAIFNLKNSAGLDYYCLNSFMIKASQESLIEPLTVLFNKCVNEGVWPDSFKITKIFPLHKKGDLNCPDNFRPIAIVPIISKIFEIIIKRNLSSYCETKHIFSDSQFGFRKNRSTLKALLSMVEVIVDGFDEGLHSNATMCDLSKAFDCVNTQILLHKLEYYGIRGNVLKLFSSYLSNRKQYVSLNGTESGLLQVENGVPQGSVLGPILFLLYINDLPYSVGDSSCIIFADDTTLITKGDDSNSGSLQLAKNWFTANKLKLNETKTQHINFTTDKWAPKSESKVLGLILDTRLEWSPHIDYLCSKLSSQIFCLKQLSRSLPSGILRTVYFAIIHSHLTCGITLWGNSNAANRLFILQKAAVRSIEGAPYGTSCLPLFKKFQIMPLPCIYIFHSLLQIHRGLNKFQTHSDVHAYNTRNAHNLIQSYSRTRTTQINKVDVRLYNHFVQCFNNVNVTSISFNKFHKLCKKFLLDNLFYSVNDYFNWSNSKG